MGELLIGLIQYFAFYNTERPHQSLAYDTPDSIYESVQGGGATIVDKYGKEEKPEAIATLGQRHPAASEAECTT
jgi:putative transposase